MNSSQTRQSTRGLWVDTRDSTVYNATLRDAITRSGGTITDYHRCWRALHKQGRWPANVPIRAATVADIKEAKRTVTYEVELVLRRSDILLVEESILAMDGWLKRVTIEKVRSQSREVRYRCVWLVSGMSSVGLLRRMVENSYGRIQEIDEGVYKMIVRAWRGRE